MNKNVEDFIYNWIYKQHWYMEYSPTIIVGYINSNKSNFITFQTSIFNIKLWKYE
jgi:hypothetical protein